MSAFRIEIPPHNNVTPPGLPHFRETSSESLLRLETFRHSSRHLEWKKTKKQLLFALLFSAFCVESFQDLASCCFLDHHGKSCLEREEWKCSIFFLSLSLGQWHGVAISTLNRIDRHSVCPCLRWNRVNRRKKVTIHVIVKTAWSGEQHIYLLFTNSDLSGCTDCWVLLPQMFVKILLGEGEERQWGNAVHCICCAYMGFQTFSLSFRRHYLKVDCVNFAWKGKKGQKGTRKFRNLFRDRLQFLGDIFFFWRHQEPFGDWKVRLVSEGTVVQTSLLSILQ